MACIAFVTMALFGGERGWIWLCRFWARGTLWIVGVRIVIVGKEFLKGPAVFVSNHQSLIDAVFVPAIMPKTVKFVAKRELGKIPFWGWAFAKGGAVLINRKDPRGAIVAIGDALKYIRPNWSIAVFPEGTRSKDGSVGPFKKGAFHIAVARKAPIVPFAMHGAHSIVPPKGFLPAPGTIYVVAGEPIITAEWKGEHVQKYAQQVRIEVQRLHQQAKALEQEKAGTLTNFVTSQS